MRRLRIKTYTALCTLAMIMMPNLALSKNTESTNQALQFETTTHNNYYKMKRVRCDRGARLSRFIKWARNGTTLKIFGKCNETIVITKDNLRLLGAQDASIDGAGLLSEAVILIQGARNVVIENLSVVNGSDQGILATQGATGKLSNLVVEEHKTVGISIDRSQFEVSDVEVSQNGTGGMDIFSASTILATGKIIASNNTGDGIAVNGKSFFELRGAQIIANSNAGSGVSVINDSRLQIFSFPEAQGSGVTANDNGFAGIGLLGSALGVVGSQFTGSGANVFEMNNNLFGFFMPAGVILSPHATAKFNASENQIGMLMEDGASILIVGGLSVQDNGLGILANGANTVHVVSIPPNPSLIVNNRLDIDVQFGSRITFEDVEVESVACDETALVRGSIGCPIEP